MLRTALKRLFDGRNVLYECRGCGNQLAEGEDKCPNCGSEEIAVYDLTEK